MTKTGKVKAILTGVVCVALAVVLAACAGTCSCRTYRRDTFDYNAVVFRGVDFDAADKSVTDARAAIDTSSTATIAAINSMTSYLNDVGACLNYAYVEYNKDTQGEYADIYLEYSSKYNELYAEYVDVCYAALERYPGEIFGEEDEAFIREQHDMTSGNYVELSNRADELLTEYYAATAEPTAASAEEIAPILIELVEVNNELAENAGYDSYVDYAYDGYDRDYDSEDADRLCGYVKRYLAPLTQDVYYAAGKAALNVSSLSPAVSAAAGAEIDRNMGAVESLAAEIGPDMSEALSYMRECDLHYTATAENDPNATQGAFTTYLSAFDAPYIYQYCTGGYSDLMTFVHEFGHFTSYYVHGANSTSNLDISEIHSQANELLFYDYLDDIYGEATADYIIYEDLFSKLYFSVIMGCVYDEFQRELYAAPRSYTTAEAISDLYERLINEYDAAWYGDLVNAVQGVNYGEGYDFNRYWWTQVTHTFASPLYYISYAVSAIPALSIWQTAETTEGGREEAIRAYDSILLDGGAAGVSFTSALNAARVPSPFMSNGYDDLAKFITDLLPSDVTSALRASA